MGLAESIEISMVDDALQDDSVINLTVCVCTFRRPELRATLASLAAQALPPNVSLRVVVTDNDEQPDRRQEVEELFADFDLAGRYVHAPKRNISIARNACLANVKTRWAAFIDDDEVAPPNWAATLLDAREGVDCVFGVSRANYENSGAPRWMVEGDFHSNFVRPRDGVANGYTCNTLFDMDFVRRHDLRFREDLGQVGGEDTMFFRAMEQAGGRFRFEPEAIVNEDVPPRRANLRWLVERQFRSGQNHYEVLLSRGKKPFGIAASSLAKAGLFSLVALCTLPIPKRAVGNYLRGVLHWGAARRAMGKDFLKEYG